MRGRLWRASNPGLSDPRRQQLVDDAAEGDLTDDDLDDAAPEQAQLDRESRDIND